MQCSNYLKYLREASFEGNQVIQGQEHNYKVEISYPKLPRRVDSIQFNIRTDNFEIGTITQPNKHTAELIEATFSLKELSIEKSMDVLVETKLYKNYKFKSLPPLVIDNLEPVDQLSR